MLKTTTSVSANWGRLLRATLACLLAFLLLNQTASAALPVANQLDRIPPGTSVQLRMSDGQVLNGKLVSHSGLTLQFVESGSADPMVINTSEVASVEPAREHHPGRTIVKGVLVGSFFALTAVAVAAAGK